jgi:cell division protein FtsZ
MAEMGKAMMGTGEGSGENRALEAAEKAIANPLLDGVSMQGAKGVIISIIGGEDMKLLEVDEAANHIRELVDPQANIIWGSAFNPDLQGKIRVSVVATGIEQGAHHVEEAPRSAGFGMARGPAVPAAAAAPVQPLFEAPSQSESRPVAAVPEPFEPEPIEVAREAASQDEPLALDDWDDDDSEEEAAVASESYASLTGVASSPSDPLDLELDQVDEATDAQVSGGSYGTSDGDDLLGNADRLADTDEPVAPLMAGRRRGLVSEPEGGSTLFERMAKLSRGSKSGDESSENDGDDGSSINIPRFLGRQNNQ